MIWEYVNLPAGFEPLRVYIDPYGLYAIFYLSPQEVIDLENEGLIKKLPGATEYGVEVSYRKLQKRLGRDYDGKLGYTIWFG